MRKPDALSIAMQGEAIRIAEARLNKSLPSNFIANIRKPWSYMGLEMIIDTVRTIDISDMERYLADLDN